MDETSEVGGGGRLRKGHRLDSPRQHTASKSLSQAEALQGLAGLLEMNGGPPPPTFPGGA